MSEDSSQECAESDSDLEPCPGYLGISKAAFDRWSELLDVYSETQPPSGSMRSGALWKRPRLVLPWSSSGSSLLPTPADSDSDRGGSQDLEKRRSGGHQPSLGDVIEHPDSAPDPAR